MMERKSKNDNEFAGIGPKSVQCLNRIGIFTKKDLETVGPVTAYMKIRNECTILKPSLNLLYGLVSVLEGVHWTEIARREKHRLLMEIEGYKELQSMSNSDPNK